MSVNNRAKPVFTGLDETPVSPSKTRKDDSTKDICFKIFIVATIILATVVVIAGILALMAVKGALPTGLEALSHLNVIGEVNSYVMIGGGITLFVLGILAWCCQVRKENRESSLVITREQ